MAVQLRSGKKLEMKKSEKDEGNKGEGSLENTKSLEKERKIGEPLSWGFSL